MSGEAETKAMATQLTAENPYPGLFPFGEADRAFFYGRDAEQAELFRLVQRDTLTLLFGQSGLGKTSLLQAGLFPRLREAQALPVAVRLSFDPSVSDLTEPVRRAIAAELEAQQVDAPPPEPTQTLWEYLQRTPWWDQRNRLLRPVLVFDQFEELFTLGRNDPRAPALLEQLADLAENRIPAAVRARLEQGETLDFDYAQPNYGVVLSLREDCLADLDNWRDLLPSLLRNRMRLLPLTGEQALAAVAKPGKALVSATVAEEIVRFVAGGERRRSTDLPELTELTVEPVLLALVCRQLNEQRLQQGQAAITAGLLRGSKDQLLMDFYERCTADLPPAMRCFIEERLLTASGFRRAEAVDNALRWPGVSEAAIATLIDRRLLWREDRFGVSHIELVHDVLTGTVQASRDLRRRREAARQPPVERQEAVPQGEKAQIFSQKSHQLDKLRLWTRRSLLLWTTTGCIAVLTVLMMILVHDVLTSTVQSSRDLRWQQEALRQDEETQIFSQRLRELRQQQEAAQQPPVEQRKALPQDEETQILSQRYRELLRHQQEAVKQPSMEQHEAVRQGKEIQILSQMLRELDLQKRLLSFDLDELRMQTRRSLLLWTTTGCIAVLTVLMMMTVIMYTSQVPHPDKTSTLSKDLQLKQKFDREQAQFSIMLYSEFENLQRKQAESLINSILLNLRDNLAKIGRLDLLEQSAQGALNYFSQLPQTEMTPAALHQRSIALDNIGDIFLANGDLNRALAAYQAALAIRHRLVQQDSANAEWQRALAVSYERLGRLYVQQGDIRTALNAVTEALTIARGAYAQQQDDTNQQLLVQILGLQSFALLFDRQFQAAITAAKEALALDPNQLRIAAYQAYGYLLSDQFEKAKAIYRQHAQDKVNDQQTFAEAILDDFAKLRQSGIDHPDMEKIEAMLRDQAR